MRDPHAVSPITVLLEALQLFSRTAPAHCFSRVELAGLRSSLRLVLSDIDLMASDEVIRISDQLLKDRSHLVP